MANAQRGEVDLVYTDADERERRYTLRLTTNAICEMQKRMGDKAYGDIVKSLQSVDMVSLRELLYATLRKHHGKDFETVESVGDLIDDCGASRVVDAITEIFLLNQPKEEPKAKKGRAAGPHAA